MIDYESLRQFATPSQVIKLDVLKKCGTQKKAANYLGMNIRSFERGLDSLTRQAAKRGYDPDNNLLYPVGKGQELKGQSVLYDADGNIKQQWVKSQSDKTAEKEERINEIFSALKEELTPLKPCIFVPPVIVVPAVSTDAGDCPDVIVVPLSAVEPLSCVNEGEPPNVVFL